MSDTLTIRLGAKLAHALDEETRQTGLTKGEIVRQALESRLQRGGQPSAMQRYFGIVRGPADPSTNKAYRRDWNKERDEKHTRRRPAHRRTQSPG